MLAEIFGMDGVIVLIVVVVLLFGGAAIPKLARNLGSAKHEFEKGVRESQPSPPDGQTANGSVSPARADETGPVSSQ